MAIDLDCLEAKLAIYGIGAGEEATFLARAIRHAASLNTYHVLYMELCRVVIL